MKSILKPGESLDLHSLNGIGQGGGSLEDTDSIAVIGMGLRLPCAKTPDEFWDILKSGIECVGDFPEERAEDLAPFIHQEYGGNGVSFMRGSYIEEIKSFSPGFWGITPKEAQLMDPSHRLFLQTSYSAIDACGYSGARIRGSNTGVYVGAISDIDIHSYKEMIRKTMPNELMVAITGTLHSTMAGMLAHHLDLRGPVLVIDTACSSSLISIHSACQALRAGECDMAIAAGVKLHMAPLDETIYKIGIESSNGVTRTFDNAADGSGFGEGIVVLLLKPAKAAIRDGDHIFAVIRGSAVNHDGFSLGLTVPNPAAQERVLTDAWKRARINPADIGYIECHGTATRLGDPIEIGAITSAFARYTDRRQFCAVGSVKSNIGHLFEASGIVGTVKAILSMMHGEIPPTINFRTSNEEINFIDSPVYVNSAARRWDAAGKPRICGVSSFGISGVNSHLILEEAPVRRFGDSRGDVTEVFTLSARTEEDLIAFAEKYSKYFLTCGEEHFLNACYTTNTGKDEFQYRLAILGGSCEEMASRLKAFTVSGFNGTERLDGVWSRKVGAATSDSNGTMGRKTVTLAQTRQSSSREQMEGLCSDYVSGGSIDWRLWYKNLSVKKVIVPTYPFENEPCWLDFSEIEITQKKDESKPQLFYKVNFVKTPPDSAAKRRVQKSFMIFSDGGDYSNRLVGELRNSGKRVIAVSAGDAYANPGIDDYSLCFDKNNLLMFFQRIQFKGVDTVIFVGAVEGEHTIRTVEDLDKRIENGFYGLAALVQALAEYRVSAKTDLVIVTDSAYEVDGCEEVCPHNAALIGLGRNINLEFSQIRCRAIDISGDESTGSVMDELSQMHGRYLIAYRSGVRYSEEFSQAVVEEKEPQAEVKPGGVYIITGGTGNIGLAMAEHLASKCSVRLVLACRSSLPERSDWEKVIVDDQDERLCAILKRIVQMEQGGSEIHIFKCDVSKEKAVESLVADTEQRFGTIHGVIHSAGVTGFGLLVSKDRAQMERVIRPKIYGTWLLNHYTKKDGLDFFVMCSSGAGMIGEIGLADYTAANAYIDSFAFTKSGAAMMSSIDWVVWKGSRMAEGFSKNLDGFFKPLEKKQALMGFDMVLRSGIRRVLVGEINFGSEYLRSIDSIPMSFEANLRERALKSLQKQPDPTFSPVKKMIAIRGGEECSYSDAERILSEIVCRILGYQEINVHDNFFDLGGNSILLNYMWRELEQIYPGRIMITDLFANPSVHRLAEFISGEGDESGERETTGSIRRSDAEMEYEVNNLLTMLDSSGNIEEALERLKNL